LKLFINDEQFFLLNELVEKFIEKKLILDSYELYMYPQKFSKNFFSFIGLQFQGAYQEENEFKIEILKQNKRN